MDPVMYPSPRVSQLDAHILDAELSSLLKQNLMSIFQFHNNKWWTYDQHPELWDLILNVILFRLTVWKTGSSYGLSLQNLKLVNFRNGKLIGYKKRTLLLGFIVGDYLFTKFQTYLYATEADENGNFSLFLKLKRVLLHHRDHILSQINNGLRLANLVNFTLFLVSGRYPSLVHRILGISFTPIVTDLLRFNGDNVNFEFQNRQLVWNVMTEFLVFILPLLQLKKLRHMSKLLLLPYKQEEVTMSPYSSLPPSQCAICHDKKDKAVMSGEKKLASLPCMVTNPYVTNCGHIFCYICLAESFNSINTSDGNDKCLRCGEKMEWFKQYEDVDTDAVMVEYEEDDEEDDEAEDAESVHGDDNDNSDSSDNTSDSDSEASDILNDVDEYEPELDANFEYEDEDESFEL